MFVFIRLKQQQQLHSKQSARFCLTQQNIRILLKWTGQLITAKQKQIKYTFDGYFIDWFFYFYLLHWLCNHMEWIQANILLENNQTYPETQSYSLHRCCCADFVRSKGTTTHARHQIFTMKQFHAVCARFRNRLIQYFCAYKMLHAAIHGGPIFGASFKRFYLTTIVVWIHQWKWVSFEI